MDEHLDSTKVGDGYPACVLSGAEPHRMSEARDEYMEGEIRIYCKISITGMDHSVNHRCSTSDRPSEEIGREIYTRRKRVPVAEFCGVPDPTQWSGS